MNKQIDKQMQLAASDEHAHIRSQLAIQPACGTTQRAKEIK